MIDMEPMDVCYNIVTQNYFVMDNLEYQQVGKDSILAKNAVFQSAKQQSECFTAHVADKLAETKIMFKNSPVTSILPRSWLKCYNCMLIRKQVNFSFNQIRIFLSRYLFCSEAKKNHSIESSIITTLAVNL